MLHGRDRTIFLCSFWSLLVAIIALRVCILVGRVLFNATGQTSGDLLMLVDRLHLGYFIGLALVETISAAFLLREFNSTHRVSVKAALSGGLFSYLMRSTEIRVALLAFVGITRAITFTFQSTVISAAGVAGQLDRLAYAMECLFPIVML